MLIIEHAMKYARRRKGQFVHNTSASEGLTSGASSPVDYFMSIPLVTNASLSIDDLGLLKNNKSPYYAGK